MRAGAKNSILRLFVFVLGIGLGCFLQTGTASAGVAAINCYGCHPDLNQANFPLGTVNVVKERHHKVASVKKITDCAYCHKVSNPTCTDCHTTAHKNNHGTSATPQPACADCHAQSVVVEHSYNRLINCIACHNDNGTFNTVIYDFVGPEGPALCTECHTTPPKYGLTAFDSHVSRHNGHIAVFSECATCHGNADIIGSTHKNNCGTCHASPRPEVTTLITNAAGNPAIAVDCASCHGTLAQKHTINSHKDATGADKITESATCSGCHAGLNGTLAGIEAVHNTPTNGAGACATCHNSLRANVQGYITNRTAVECTDCHGPGHDITVHRDKVTSADKITETAGCVVCHTGLNGQLTGVEAVHNTPTNGAGACATCHASPRTDVRGFIDARAAVACADCHGAHDINSHSDASGNAKITETAGCNACHTALTGTLAGVEVIHDVPTNGAGACATCHSSSRVADIISAALSNGTSVACADCHTAHSMESHKDQAGNAKISVVAGCVDCHTVLNGGTLAAIGQVHIPASGGISCATCHNSPRTDVQTLIAAKNPVTCNDCHGVTPNKHDSSGHDKAVLPADEPICAACHVADVVQEHVVNLNKPCTTCHADSLFAGYIQSGIDGNPVDCLACHGYMIGSTPDAALATHNALHHGNISVFAECSSCHGDAGIVTVTHKNNCASCHAGSTRADVKAVIANMVASPAATADCVTCHGTLAQKHDINSHADASGNARIIENGGCAACHTGLTGTLAGVEVVHDVTTNGDGACATCHNSSRVAGIISTAVINGTSVQCSDCHAAHEFAGIHAITESAGCIACHTDLNGMASGIEAVHATTTNGAGACATCHNTADATVRGFINDGVAQSFVCADCHAPGHTIDSHGNNITAPTECAGCHADLTILGLLDGMDALHTPDGGTSSCATCHASTSRVIGIINTATAPETNATVSCADCHGVTPNKHDSSGHDKAVLPATETICAECHAADVVQEHVVKLNRPCTSCHADSMFAGYIESGIAGNPVDCLACHSWMIGSTPSMALATHNLFHHDNILVATDCGSCHGGAVVDATHKNNCANCHAGTTRSAVKTVIAGMVANPAMTADCLTCHSTGGHNFVVVHQISDAGCANCHDKLTSDPASIETLHDVPTNGPGACATCHSSDRPEVVQAIAARSPINCTACHVPHTAAHDMVILPSDGCDQCHVANPVTEHVDNRGWGCVDCHSSARDEVQQAITRGSNGGVVNCADCHLGNLNHMAAHDQTFVPNAACKDCHVENVVAEHVDKRGLACGICHNGGYQTIIDSGKAGNPVLCTACHDAVDHSTAHNKTGAQVALCVQCHDEDVAVEHVTNRGRTCLICHGNPDYAATINLGKGDNGSLVTCAECHPAVPDIGHAASHDMAFLNSGNCADCHNGNVVTEHLDVRMLTCDTCHGANPVLPDSQATITAGKAGTAVFCSDCHDSAGSHADQHDMISAPQTYCAGCHNVNVVIEHVDNRGFSCLSCHADSQYADTIAAGMSGAAVDCYDCHIASDHTADHNMTDVAAAECAGCHNANVVTEHIDTAGRTTANGAPVTCLTCHGNSAYNSYIAAGRAGTMVVCTDCHGAADHKAAHDMTVVPSTGCSNCHNPNVVVEHVEKRNLACGVCHNATYQAVIDSGAAGSQVSCLACHAMPDHHAGSTDAMNGNCTLCHTVPDWAMDSPVQAACRQCHINGSGYVKRADGSTVHSVNSSGAIKDFGACFNCHDPGPYHAKPAQWPGWYQENAKSPGRGSFNIFYSAMRPRCAGDCEDSMEDRRNYGEDGSPGRDQGRNWRTPSISFNWATVQCNGITYDVPSFGGTRGGDSGGSEPPPPPATTAPKITSLDRTSGSRGTTVTINGTDFGSTQGSSYVLFGASTKPSIRSWSSTRIQFTVPSVSRGTYPVSVVVNGVASNAINFSRN